ncbi:hypothetical protein [Variovorax sp. Varisp62]|uniref:hypothetical protein n=1 Tax=Variovorax sp. Varisp62 TaxID=3243049 RepID=UPI0039B4F339
MDQPRRDSVNALKRAAATANGESRSQEIRTKMKNAMALIDQELIEHRDVYPYNEGRLTLEEICKRGGIGKVTLYGKKHRELKTQIDDWLSAIKERILKSRTEDSDTRVAEPAPRTWEEMYKEIGNAYAIDALRWREDRALREVADQRILELEALTADLNLALEGLRVQLSAFTDGRVVPLGSKKVGA